MRQRYIPGILAVIFIAAATAFGARASLQVTVEPGERDWQHAPVRVQIDSALAASGWTAEIQPYMVTVTDADGADVPCRAGWSEEGEDAGIVIFTRHGSGSQTFTITVDTRREDRDGRPVPIVGMGEPLSYGRTGVVTNIDGSYNSHLAAGDWDGDGDTDVFMRGGDGRGWTFHGLSYYENTAGAGEPVMAKPVRMPGFDGDPMLVDWNGDGRLDLVVRSQVYINTGQDVTELADPDSIPYPPTRGRLILADWNGDNLLDVVESFGHGGGGPSESTWNKEECDTSSPYTPEGVWRGYEKHGMVRVYYNVGMQEAAEFSTEPDTLRVEGNILDVPSGGNQAVGDIDGDGDQDLLMGNRFDLYWFENTGTASEPVLARGYPLNLGLEDIYIRPVVADMDSDGDQDIIFGNEGGDARWLCNTGNRTSAGYPDMLPTRVLTQRDPFIDAGSVGAFDIADLNGDEQPDVILGNSYGEVWLALSQGNTPWVFDAARRVSAGTSVIRVFAGASGSIQGPEEAHYGYVAPEIADWNQDGTVDLILHDVWGKFRLYPGERITPQGPVFGAETSIRFNDPTHVHKPAWTWWDPVDGELVTQWRCRADVLDCDGDGITDMTAMDHRGFMALYRGIQTEDGKRIGPLEHAFTDLNGQPILLNDGCHGRSGRRKHMFADWDRDGDLDLIRNMASPAMNHQIHREEFGHAAYYENMGDNRFAYRGEMVPDTPPVVGHGSCPIAYDFDNDGWLDLLVGAECGHIFVYHRSYLERDLPTATVGNVEVRE